MPGQEESRGLPYVNDNSYARAASMSLVETFLVGPQTERFGYKSIQLECQYLLLKARANRSLY
jgi:hypothetical protein